MTETEYIRATNRVKISTALTILNDVLPGPENGISRRELIAITSRLDRAQEKLFASYELIED